MLSPVSFGKIHPAAPIQRYNPRFGQDSQNLMRVSPVRGAENGVETQNDPDKIQWDAEEIKKAKSKDSPTDFRASASSTIDFRVDLATQQEQRKKMQRPSRIAWKSLPDGGLFLKVAIPVHAREHFFNKPTVHYDAQENRLLLDLSYDLCDTDTSPDARFRTVWTQFRISPHDFEQLAESGLPPLTVQIRQFKESKIVSPAGSVAQWRSDTKGNQQSDRNGIRQLDASDYGRPWEKPPVQGPVPAPSPSKPAVAASGPRPTAYSGGYPGPYSHPPSGKKP